MALGALLDAFFTDEWVRFTRGLAKLDPEQQRLAMLMQGQTGLLPGEPATVSIPGWDEIIKLGPRYQPTSAERTEYYSALQQKRTPQISTDALASMQYSTAVRERIRTSAEPGYAQAFGEILTATDNVQDFFSTVSTLGRVGLWTMTRGFDWLAPGFSTQAASELAAASARTAEQLAASTFERGLLDAVAKGEPVAAYLLGEEAALTAARRAAVELAGKAAFQAAFRSAILGLGTRAALRLLPVVGWALLAADLINLLSLLGMLAMPAYALLCRGPEEALVAGIPAMLFGKALKNETWTMHDLNPLSREARAKRRARVLRGIPTVGNLLEVFQTTEQLWGVGITLGGLVGTMMESGFALERNARGEPVRFNYQSAVSSFTDPSRATATSTGKSLAELGAWLHGRMAGNLSTMSYADLVKNQQAATVLATAPAILATQDTFDDETHLKTMLAVTAALSTLAPVMRGTGWQDRADELADVELDAPWPPSPETMEWARAFGYPIEQSRRWPWPAAGRMATGREYVEHFAAAIPDATRRFFVPRRNTVEGAMYGGIVNAVAEAVWLFMEEDDQLLKWRLSTDAALISSLMEANRLVNANEKPERVWALWQDAGHYLKLKGDATLQADQWDWLAKKHGITLIKLLPPGSPWPEEWFNWINALPKEDADKLIPPPII